MFRLNLMVKVLASLAVSTAALFSPCALRLGERASPEAFPVNVVIKRSLPILAVDEKKVGTKTFTSSQIAVNATPVHAWSVLSDYGRAPGIVCNLAKPPDQASHPENMTILFLGVDSNGGRTRFAETRSDTTMLLTVEPKMKKLSITSIPRDSQVYIKGYGLNKINAAHAYGGPQLAVNTVAAVFGIHVDRYVVLDTAGLRKVCELMGPLEVVVEKKMSYTDHAGRLRINLKPGRQLLSPAQVEQYVRFRHDSESDIGRIQRQQWFIRQAFAKINDPSFLWKLPQMISIARDAIRTDCSLEDMVRMAMTAREIKPSEVLTASLPGHAASVSGVSYWILDMDSARAIFNRIYDHQISDSIGSSNVRLRIAIEYAAGSAQDAHGLELSLKKLGYGVKLKRVVRAADCVHEQILLSSAIVSRTTIDQLRTSIPMIAGWPEVIAARQPGADLTFVIPGHKS